MSDRVVGFVEATRDDAGFDEADGVEIREIADACAPVLANLRQLEQTKHLVEKFEILNRVCDQIRTDDSGNPLQSTRIASLIRNLFEADWLYFGSIDHENDYSTTEISDGLSVPELAHGVQVARRSLLIPSTTENSDPVSVDLESEAPGQRASGRWMYRAGLRSALCAPLSVAGSVVAMFMCASRKPVRFGSLEKKLAVRIVFELEASIEKANSSEFSHLDPDDTALTVKKRSGPDLQGVLDNMPVIVMTLDRKGIVTDTAGGGIASLNLVPEQLIGRDFIAYSRKINGLEVLLNRALNGHSGQTEVELFGTVLDVWVKPVVSENDTTDGTTVAVSDITDKVNAARANTTLQKLRDERERTNKFIASVSHEMKSPLTAVVTVAELLGENERGNLHPDQRERLSVVQQNADRLMLLVNDFLNISKMEATMFESRPAQFRIAGLAGDIETSFAPIAMGQGQKLSVTVPGDHQFALADRELLRQAIINLLTNASKYSPVDTTISLDIWVDERDLRITVTDEGPGIPQEERDKIFEPYRQLENPDVPGTGMGLTIVRQIVELHDGSVWAEDGVGGGTSFAIWLPDSVIKPSPTPPTNWLST